MNKNLQAALAVVSIVAFGPIIWMGWSSGAAVSSPPDTVDGHMRAGARAACWQAIAGELKDPASAQWGPLDGDDFYGRWAAIANPESGLVTVYPAFRARNSFGAVIPSEWECTAREADGAWSILSLQERG